MLKTFYLSASALAILKCSPDGRYLALSEPGAFHLYEISDQVLLKLDFPFEESPIDFAFAFNFEEKKTTEIALLFDEGLFRFELGRSNLDKIEIYQFVPEVACSFAYGTGSLYVGTESGSVIRVELENNDHPNAVIIDQHFKVSDGAVVLLRPTPSSDEGTNIYTDRGELLFFNRLYEELLLIEPPMFQSSADRRWSLVGLEYCQKTKFKAYSGWSSSGTIYLGCADYTVGIRLASSGLLEADNVIAEIISVVPLSDSQYLIATPNRVFRLTVKSQDLDESDKSYPSSLENLSLDFAVVYTSEPGYRIVSAYPLADDSDTIHVIKTRK